MNDHTHSFEVFSKTTIGCTKCKAAMSFERFQEHIRADERVETIAGLLVSRSFKKEAHDRLYSEVMQSRKYGAPAQRALL